MNIYFAGSIRGGRSDQELYDQIIRLLSTYGTVLTEHFGDKDIKASDGMGKDSRNIYEQDISWLLQSDVVVAEVSTPSLGVGFEIGVAAYSRQKPVLCLYRPEEGKSLSSMIAGCPNVINHTYQIVEDLPSVFDSFFSQVKRLHRGL